MKYVVKSPLRHDQRAYRAGETVDMPAGQAAVLEAAGVIERQAEPEKSSAKKRKTKASK